MLDGAFVEAATQAAEHCRRGKRTHTISQSLVAPHSAVLLYLQRVGDSREGLEDTEVETALEDAPLPQPRLPRSP